MDDEFEGFEDDDEPRGCSEGRVEHEDSGLVEPYRFSWGLLLGEWLDNTGDILEHLAEYPKAATRRLFAHHQHEQSTKLTMAEAARQIEHIEQFANREGRDG